MCVCTYRNKNKQLQNNHKRKLTKLCWASCRMRFTRLYMCVCVCVWCEAFYQSVSQPAARLHECACVCVHACIYVYMLNIFISSANWTLLQCINQCNFAIALAGGTHRAQQTDTHTQATATTLSTLWENWKLFSFSFFEAHSQFVLNSFRCSPCAKLEIQACANFILFFI